MKFAYSSFVYRNYDIFETIDRIADLGYKGIEIQADRPHLFPEDFDLEKLAKLKQHLIDRNLVLSNINAFTLVAIEDFHHPSWIEKDEKERRYRIEHTKRCIEIASYLGCPHISTEPGGKLDFFDREKSMSLFIDGLKEVLDFAETKNVKLLIEPEPDLLLETSDHFLELIEKVNHPLLRLNLDLGHFYCVNEDPAEIIIKLKDYIEHIHIEDIRDRIHDHKILGNGDMNFDSIFKALNEINYNGFVTVELYPYYDTPDLAGKRSLEFLQKYK